MRFVSIAALLALGACASSGSSSDDVTSAAAPLLSIGTQAGEATARNGLSFADADSVIEDVNGAGPVQIKVVRARTDWETGTTQLVVSDETIEFVDLRNREWTITLDGEELVFTPTSTPDTPWGGSWPRGHATSNGAVSATGEIYAYARGDDRDVDGAFDTEAFFAFGYETDPSEIVATLGEVVYSSDWFGYGQLLNADGTVANPETYYDGNITLTAQFDDAAINGVVSGTWYGDRGGILHTTEMEFDTNIDGNGYASALNCTSGCVANASEIGGAFFGQDALETSGVMGFDVTADVNADVDFGDGIETVDGQYRLIGGAGYTATQAEP